MSASMTSPLRPSSFSLIRTALSDAWGLARRDGVMALGVSVFPGVFFTACFWLAVQIVISENKPFGLFFLALILASLSLLLPKAVLMRRAGLAGTNRQGQGSLFGDVRRYAIVWLLLLVLGFTVLGSAGFALIAMLAALDLAARSAADAPAIDSDAADTALPQLGEYFGQTEWVIAALVIAGFAFFAAWFQARLSLAYAATTARQAVQALSSFALTRGRWIAVFVTFLVASIPTMAFAVLVRAAFIAVFDAQDLTTDLVLISLLFWVGATLTLAIWLVSHVGIAASLCKSLNRDM